MYSKINSIKSPTSGAGNVSKSRLVSQVGRVCVVQRVSAIRAVKVPVFFRLRSSCYHVTEVGGPYGL